MAITRFRVKEAFSATLLLTRRRETFVPGELIVLVDRSETASESRFIRVNSIRRSRPQCVGAVVVGGRRGGRILIGPIIVKEASDSGARVAAANAI